VTHSPGGDSWPVWSPDGTRLAFWSSTGVAADLAVARIGGGVGLFDIDGSATASAIVWGPGGRAVYGETTCGDDTLYADDTYYFFDGDTLLGGPGNDTLVGGFGQDSLYGGPGDDTLSGGPSKDVLVGGSGHDHIDGGGGGDLIGAQDGERDWISCGPNGYGRGGRDVVYADRVDVVASDCEIVHRR